MKPVKPEVSECCGSGCTPCVFDVYEAEFKKWERGENNSDRSSQLRSDLLSKLKYMPFKVVSSSNLTPDVHLYRFQPCTDSKNKLEKPTGICDYISGQLGYTPSQHFIMRCPQTMTAAESTSIESKNRLSLVSEQTDLPPNDENESIDTQMSYISERITKINENLFVSRAYTPISLAYEERNCCFDMIIKLYKDGVMSSFLRNLNAGDLVHFRGPYGGYEHIQNSYSSLTMICAGTGIAPMISIIKSIIRNENDETFILLLFTVSNFQSIILRDDIQNFCHNWNVTAKIYLTNECNWNEISKFIRHNEIIINHRITEEIIKAEVLSRKSNQILICGPTGFCEQVRSWLHSSGDEDVRPSIFVF